LWEKFKLHAHSHPHSAFFLLEPFWACGVNRVSHTETDAEKRCNTKKQPKPKAILWLPQTDYLHKEKNHRKKEKSTFL
jgi:hypothetical protein